ncbi:caspase family protein [Aquincola sp. J276]|uniref:caspase family protein n=1 Tax=Aquincola sp. J276 TaxID=2898432 RepID=UPI0021518F36|nr:caspase family protein [Aquincola sp. J276]MCR5864929.1 caspase family protein [Aquincola sp. J276]
MTRPDPEAPSALRRRLASRLRRRLWQWPLAAWLGGAAGRVAAQYGAAPVAPAGNPSPAATAPVPTVAPEVPAAVVLGERLALVLGNRAYPEPFDLPSIHKNVRDMEAALARRGFQVTAGIDLDPAAARATVEAFLRRVAAAPPDAIVLFYFSGHGVQLNAENLLLGAGVNPSGTPETLLKGSMVLQPDVVLKLPRREQGLTIAVIDACRTDLRAALKPGEGLNQVEAPPGCLIAFSTGAGKPALAPNNETQNTFYTGALVHQLGTASDELSFSDLFRLVKLETQRTMLNHPVSLIRQFAQFPFIAENTRQPVLLAARPASTAAAGGSRFRTEDEAGDWATLQATVWPPDVVRLADRYLQRWPDSKLAGGAEVMREGAKEAAAILRRNDIRLFRRSFEPHPGADKDYQADLLKAARGDKDAAARVGRAWRTGAQSGAELSRYEGWMQYAAELGNGIASYELALHYRRQDQPQPAARWEARARELGYTPPPSLDNQRK